VIGACGIVCDECDIHRAAEDASLAKEIAARFQQRLGTEVAAEDIRCEGCKGARDRHWSPDCWILKCCVDERGLEFCYQCEDFPCPRLAEWASTSPRYTAALERLKKMEGECG